MAADTAAGSVFDAFCASVERFAERPFLRQCANATSGFDASAAAWSYSSAAAEVAVLMAQYAGAGSRPGDRVAFAAERPADVYLHLLAVNGLGMSLVPLNLQGSDAEISYVLSHSDSKLVVVQSGWTDRLRKIAGDIGGCRLLTEHELAAAAVRNARPAAGDDTREAALLYTSGTTGKPKGCILSNDYFLTLGRWYNALHGYCVLESSDRLLTPLPPTHMNALCTSFMAMLTCGGCVVQLDRFHPSTWWHTVRSEHATVIHYLGVMPAILLSLPVLDTEDFGGQVKFGFGAGADPRHHGSFEQRFGFPLLEAWAMTETGAGAAIIANREPRHVGRRCIGRPPPDVDYRIVDEADREVDGGEPGELLVRRKDQNPGKGFFSGYYKDEEATRDAWRGGWFHTGDVVRAGPDGSLFFVDRRKNVIRRSGENISAVEVESTLMMHPCVANCAVTAVPDELRGDEVFAFLVPASGVVADQDAAHAVVDYCLEQLSYFKAPAYVAWVEELPLTASQKVNRKDLRSAACARIERAACFDFRPRKKPPKRMTG